MIKYDISDKITLIDLTDKKEGVELPQASEIGKRCVGHPYFECNLDYEMMYRFFNFVFEGNCTFYTTERTFNAGYWCELPEEKTTNAEDMKKALYLLKNIFRKPLHDTFFLVDERHIFIL